MNKTEIGEYTFTVKEDAVGTPHIVFEPSGGEHKFLKESDGILGFELPKGTTYDEAKEIARFLNKNIKSLLYSYSE